MERRPFSRRALMQRAMAVSAVVLTACGTQASAPTAVPSSPQSKAAATPAPAAPVASPAVQKPAAAATTAAPAAQSKTGSVRDVAVALATDGQSSFGFLLAIEKGFYREEGLNIDAQLPAPLVGVQGVIAGQFHFSTAGAASALSSVSGQPIKVVLNTQRSATFWLLAGPQTGVQSVADLRGKQVAIEGPRTISDTFMRALLRKHGVDPNTEVEYLGVGPASNWIPPVVSGAVDAAFAPDVDPYVLGKRQGLVDIAQVGDELGVTINGVGVTGQVLAEQPDLVRRFVRGAIKGLRYYRERKDEAVALAMRRLGQDESLASESYDVMREYTLEEPMVSEASQQAFIDLAKEQLGNERTVNPSDVFQYDVTRQALQELANEGWSIP